MKKLFKKTLATVATPNNSKQAAITISALNTDNVVMFLGCVIGVIGSIAIGMVDAYKTGGRDALRAEYKALKSIDLVDSDFDTNERTDFKAHDTELAE